MNKHTSKERRSSMLRTTLDGVRELLHCRPEDIIWEMEERDVPVDNLHVSRISSSSRKTKAH